MGQGFARGFKKRCDGIVVEVRGEIGLPKYAPFDPFAYARTLLVPCDPVSELAEQGCSAEALAHVVGKGRDDFSAVTVYRGTRRGIVYNDHNSPERQKSDVSHELSHVLLEHEPGPVFGLSGCRRWDAEQEREAAWLSGALLVPNHVALMLARCETPLNEAALRYGVSVQLMRWRLNASGAVKRARREKGSKG